jgi:hypothetical protein
MEKEKVEVLGMVFNRGEEPLIGALERDKDGNFYGTEFGYDYMNLQIIKPYLKGGERYIDNDGGTYTFSKNFNDWIGLNSLGDVLINITPNDSEILEVTALTSEDYNNNEIDVFITYASFETKIHDSSKTNRKPFEGKHSVEVGLINDYEDSEIRFGNVVDCRYTYEEKTYNGELGFDGEFIILKLDEADTVELKDKYITIEFCGKIKRYSNN